MSALSLFFIFFRLGLTSFGGPVAHLGYFRSEFVDDAYSNMVALAQFVPGPASSQMGFGLGLLRGGPLGGLAAWAGFTLPSALIMLAAAYGLSFTEQPWAQGLIHGLKLLAVAVVAQAVLGMAKSFCPDKVRATLAFLVAALLIAAPAFSLQLGAIALGFVIGMLALPKASKAEAHDLPALRAPLAPLALAAFFILLAGLPVVAHATQGQDAALFTAFYQAGALVFGGGHVVLPLLQETVVQPGFISSADFLAGYGAAQALPGPLFSIAAFIGAKMSLGPQGPLGGILALAAISLPGLLIFYGALPYWTRLQSSGSLRRGALGVNAAVVGLLGAALYRPIFTTSVISPLDAAIALLAFCALVILRLPVLLVVALTGAVGIALKLLA
jgi:chromate transporter